MDPKAKLTLASRLEEAEKIIREVSEALRDEATTTPEERAIGRKLLSEVVAQLNAEMIQLRGHAQVARVENNRKN